MQLAHMNTSDFLPLKPEIFQILLALERRPLHGYGIVADVEDRSGGTLQLLPSLLYRRLARLLEEGLVEQVEGADEDPDPRRRYYALTRMGRQVVRLEADRIIGLATDLSERQWAEG